MKEVKDPYDAELNQKSADFACKTLNTSEFKETLKDIFKSNMLAQGLSHGYFMGQKWAVDKYTKGFLAKIGVGAKPPMEEIPLRAESEGAAAFYLRHKARGGSQDHRLILRIMIARGFRHGVRDYETDLVREPEATSSPSGNRESSPSTSI